MKRQKAHEKGQILLIVVLVMVIVLTVALSLSARSITNLRTTQEEENSERAFSAAEAGIEQSGTSNIESSGSFLNRTAYQTKITTLSGIEMLLNDGIVIIKDEAMDVWLTDYPNYSTSWNGDVTVYWGQSSDSCGLSEASNTMAALEIIVISGAVNSPVITHYPVDPCSSRASRNRFESIAPGGGIVSGKSFSYKKTITISSGKLMRVIPIYASTPLGVKGCNSANTNCLALPSQGRMIESTGAADNIKRKIVTFQSFPKLPVEIFPFVLFSPR